MQRDKEVVEVEFAEGEETVVLFEFDLENKISIVHKALKLPCEGEPPFVYYYLESWHLGRTMEEIRCFLSKASPPEVIDEFHKMRIGGRDYKGALELPKRNINSYHPPYLPEDTENDFEPVGLLFRRGRR